MPYFCYLVKSVATKLSTACYIGFSTNPKRRLRQHNGEITSGARRTSKHRPWEHICIVSGFPNKILALQFEWQWQHPADSRIIKKRLDFNPKGRGGFKTSLRVLRLLLTSPLWKQLNLCVHFLDESKSRILDSLNTNEPAHGAIRIRTTLSTSEEIDQMHLAKKKPRRSSDHILSCCICDENCAVAVSDVDAAAANTTTSTSTARRVSLCPQCSSSAHLVCIASSNEASTVDHGSLIPASAKCLNCGNKQIWTEIVSSSFIPVICSSSEGEDDDDDNDVDKEEEGEEGGSRKQRGKKSKKRTTASKPTAGDGDDDHDPSSSKGKKRSKKNNDTSSNNNGSSHRSTSATSNSISSTEDTDLLEKNVKAINDSNMTEESLSSDVTVSGSHNSRRNTIIFIDVDEEEDDDGDDDNNDQEEEEEGEILYIDDTDDEDDFI